MWSGTKTAMLFAAGLLLCGGGPADAATLDVNIPFNFIVEGRTLPAGEYEVRRDLADPSLLLIQGQHGTSAAMFILTQPAAGHDPAGDAPALTFDRFEDQYRLVRIWESAREGQQVPGEPAQSKSAAAPASMTHAATHATRGIVKSIDANTLVITRTGKMSGDMTFTLGPATHLQGTVAEGTSVAVRYHEDGKTNVATAITAQQPKHEMAHAAAPKP